MFAGELLFEGLPKIVEEHLAKTLVEGLEV